MQRATLTTGRVFVRLTLALACLSLLTGREGMAFPPAAPPKANSPAPMIPGAARPQARASVYQPLKTGTRHQLAGTTKVAILGAYKTTVALHNEKTVKVEGVDYHMVHRDVEGVPIDLDGTDYFRFAEDGLHQGFINKKGVFRGDRLVMPEVVTIGDKWTVTFPNGRVQEIEAVVLEPVTIDGQTYNDCLLLRTTSGEDGDDERIDRWFAPGLGMVKQYQQTSRYKLELRIASKQN